MDEINVTITKLRGRFHLSGTEGAKMEKATWKNTFYPHSWVGHITIHQENAKKMYYPYFMWNGEVYRTADGVCTGETIDDLNCTNDIAILDRVDSVLASAQEVVRKVCAEKDDLLHQMIEMKDTLRQCAVALDAGHFHWNYVYTAAGLKDKARNLANKP